MEAKLTLDAAEGVAVTTVLTTSSTESINITLAPCTLTGGCVVTVGEFDDDTISLLSSTGAMGIEVVIITVLTVAEAFVIGVDVLEVFLAGDARMLVIVLDADVTSFIFAYCEFARACISSVASIAYAAAVDCRRVTEAGCALIMSWAGASLTVRMADRSCSQIAWSTVCTSVDTSWVTLLTLFVIT